MNSNHPGGVSIVFCIDVIHVYCDWRLRAVTGRRFLLFTNFLCFYFCILFFFLFLFVPHLFFYLLIIIIIIITTTTTTAAVLTWPFRWQTVLKTRYLGWWRRSATRRRRTETGGDVHVFMDLGVVCGFGIHGEYYQHAIIQIRTFALDVDWVCKCVFCNSCVIDRIRRYWGGGTRNGTWGLLRPNRSFVMDHRRLRIDHVDRVYLVDNKTDQEDRTIAPTRRNTEQWRFLHGCRWYEITRKRWCYRWLCFGWVRSTSDKHEESRKSTGTTGIHYQLTDADADEDKDENKRKDKKIERRNMI